MIAIILAIILFATPAMGMNLHSAMMMVTRSQVVGILGDISESYANTNSIAENEVDCILYSANKTGTANQAYLNHVGTNTDRCKVGVCNYDSDAPDAGDDGCLWTSGDVISTAGKITLTGDIGKAVTNGTSYWVCVLAGSGGCDVEYNQTDGTRTMYYEGNSYVGTYASPPTDLSSDAAPWASSGSRDWGVYVEIN